MELEIKDSQTNVIADGIIGGKIVQFTYSHKEGGKPLSVGFISVEGTSSINGTYYAESKQFSININNMETQDGIVIQGIFDQCLVLTDED